MCNVLVSNGCAEAEVVVELAPLMDAANIDLKGPSQEFYDWTGGSFAAVCRTIEMLHRAGCHVEVTTLVIPGRNDSDESIDAIAERIAAVSPEIGFVHPLRRKLRMQPALSVLPERLHIPARRMCRGFGIMVSITTAATKRRMLGGHCVMKKSAVAILGTVAALALGAAPVKIIFDTDMITDFDDVGALACLHALADAGECEILATVSSTRGNASVGAVQVINSYYGRGDLPVGSPKGMGVMGAFPGAKEKVDPASPLGEKAGGDGGHYKYRKLLADYPGWYRYADADDAPDANEVYRRVLAAQPDGSVTICSVGFLTNLRRLLETKPDDISPLDGRALVARKVKLWVAMACRYPDGKEYNSMWDCESSRIALENWPTPIVFSDWQYGCDCFAGRAVAEMDAERSPVKDVFAGNIPSRDEIRGDPHGWLIRGFGMGGRSAWDETAVLAAVRGIEPYFNAERGMYRMVGDKGDDEWAPDAENGPHVRITEKLPKAEVGRIIDGLITRRPKGGK